ncbi:MAG: HNH endonuclease signature motif containing protein, partial [Candidatus Nanopelagicales bacterium]|nr:HNH endonuclease signature motif containing protein [Candidatus Nanopelagicales bacterium]
KWRLWVTDAASSTVTATGSRTYTPGAALARLVRAREPYCRHPGCRRQSQACDLDHAVAWPKGATTAQNLGPLCRRHHGQKTHHGWDLDPGLDPGPDPKTGQDRNEAAAGWTWRTPAGITITDKPPPPLLE